jgi:type 2 lantibiotic biosynthesis protein LanM
MNVRVLKLAHAGTDRVGLEEREITFEDKNHLPVLDSEWQAAERYAENIKDGFVEMYRMLSAQIPFLVSAEGIPKFFRGSEVRLVFRPTQLYASLINTSLHPDYLGDALERRMFFEQLHVIDPTEQWRNELLASEIADLGQLDVPYFVQPFESTHLCNSRGAPVQGLRFPSALDVVSEHVSLLGENDLRAQLALIDGALQPLDDSAAASAGDHRFARGSAEPVTEFATRAAGEIADRLLATMVARGNDRYWLCKTVVEEGRVTTAPSVVSLYDGQLGIAVFLAEAARVLHRDDCAEAALAALRTLRRWTQDGRRYFPSAGVFNGALGLPYAFARVGDALASHELLSASLDLLASFDPDRFAKGGLDILDGAAGGLLFLGSMQRLLEQRGSPRIQLRGLMQRFADQLVRGAVPQVNGVGWMPQAPNRQPLTGFAHGNAGYAAALYTAAQHLGKPAYRELARAAITYENSHFSPHEHWLDLRERGPADHAPANKRMCAWCSGSAGVLLGRLLCLKAVDTQHADAALLLEDARRAARIAWAEHELSSAGNLSLCHGALGNLDILAFAAQQPELGTIIPEQTCREWFAGGNCEWRCGDDFRSPLRLPTAAPGLMTGLAGIGLGLLRQVSPRVPSVLALDVFAQA